MAVVLRSLRSIILPRITGMFMKNVLISIDFVTNYYGPSLIL